MTISEFSTALYDFHKSNQKINSLNDLLVKAKDFFLKNLDDLDEAELAGAKISGTNPKEKKKYLVSSCETIINVSNDAIKRYDNSSGTEGFDDFYEVFFPSDKAAPAANIKPISRNSNFFRMRTTKTEKYEYKFFNRNELFVIPKELDSLVGRLRFNDEGKPSLYLGNSLYIVWEECRRPPFDLVNFCRFSNERSLKVMSIYIEQRMKTLGEFIMGYFTLLTCMKTHNDDEKHQFQYVVSNMFMKCIIRNIQRKGDIDGIEYLSSRRYDCDDLLMESKTIDKLYAFPQKQIVTKGVCPQLVKMFKMTKPRTFFLYKVHRFFDWSIAKTGKYQDSIFGEIENQLLNEKLDFSNA